MVLAVALAMAEVCSRYPTAGGLYFWAGRLAKRNKRQWAWFVGWFNFLGEVAVTAAIDFGCAITWMAFASLICRASRSPRRKIFVIFVVIIVAARPAQHVRGQPGRLAVQHLAPGGTWPAC